MSETVFVNIKSRSDTDNNNRANDETRLRGEIEVSYDAQAFKVHNGADSFLDLPLYKGWRIDGISANKNYLASDPETDIYVTTGAVDKTVGLTAGSQCPDREFRITKIDSGAGKVTINATINGKSSYVITEQYQYVILRQYSGGYTIIGQSEQYTRLSDNDIGTGNTTTTIASMKAIPYGQPFLISWYDGDGTYTHTITSAGAETINGVVFSEWIGQGVGYWKLVQTADGVFELLNDGEIWDSDGGNFNGTWEKSLTGVLSLSDSITLTATIPKPGTFEIAFSSTPNDSHKVGRNTGSGGDQLFIGLVRPTSTTAYGAYGAKSDNGVNYTSGVMDFEIDGRWTDLFPRIS